MKAGEPLFQDVILYGRELTQDDLFDENEKENIARDMAQLQENYDELRNFVDDEQERFVFSACYHTSSLRNVLYISGLQTHFKSFKENGRCFQISIVMKETDCVPVRIYFTF